MIPRIFLFALIFVVSCCIGGCRTPVYDNDFSDSVRYSPELEMDYIKNLSQAKETQVLK